MSRQPADAGKASITVFGSLAIRVFMALAFSINGEILDYFGFVKENPEEIIKQIPGTLTGIKLVAGPIPTIILSIIVLAFYPNY